MRGLRWCVAMLLALSCAAVLACEPSNVKDAMSGQKANFKDLPNMIGAMKGTWVGCDDSGNPVKITVSNYGTVDGTMAHYGNDHRTDYTNCSWHALRNSMVFPNVGSYSVNVTAIACAEDPKAQDATHGDTGQLYLFGGRDTISYIVVEVKNRNYAVVKKAP
ncbi:hypothetical protein [Sulfuricella sp.]|uniref:hypothetical protein n=1 Tax=Sulfuricella sp. TaxID=2099377 RepID=UPI002CFC6532|nr:hypothetical protein [Sulfuricella sp.]HUX64904.1 hypothetical protein [Sulfuricella sp.]